MNKKKLTAPDKVLQAIIRYSPISRSDIATITKVTPASTTLIVASLIEMGLVYECGIDDTDTQVGRKKINLDIHPDFLYTIGVNFNEYEIYTCICDLKGNGIHFHQVSYKLTPTLDISNKVLEVIEELLNKAEIPLTKFLGIGIAIPGHRSADNCKIISNHKRWQNFDATVIKDKLHIPVTLQNNVRCMATYQFLHNGANTPPNFSFFHISYGMYCANFVNHKLFVGHDYAYGEIGHSTVDPRGIRCDCGKYGCLQTVASEGSLIASAQMIYEHSYLKHLVSCKEDITIDTILKAYEIADIPISNIVNTAINYLSITVGNIAIFTNSEKIYIHSKLFNSQKTKNVLIDDLAHALPVINETSNIEIEVIPSVPFNDALGAAAYLVADKLLEKNYFSI